MPSMSCRGLSYTYFGVSIRPSVSLFALNFLLVRATKLYRTDRELKIGLNGNSGVDVLSDRDL